MSDPHLPAAPIHAAPPVWHVGLTGGIGSGKSTVGQLLKEAGAVVIDADGISRAATAPGGSAIPAIRAEFGPSFVTPEQALNRDAMRDLIFREPQARLRLEAIIHPLVQQEMGRQAQTAMRGGARVVLYDIPLLAEHGHWRRRFDHVVVVDCDEPTQIARVMARNGLPRDTVEAIIRQQASRTQRRRVADTLVRNGQDIGLRQLKAQAHLLARHFGLHSALS